MQNTAITVAALVDQQTAQFILSLRQWLGQQGFAPVQDALPPHIALAAYAPQHEADVLRLTADAAAKTRSFSFSYSHVGVVPEFSAEGATLMLAPEVNRPMLSLRERFIHGQGLLHTPLLTMPTPLLPQVLPWVLPNVKPFDVRVTALAVFRQDGAMLLRQEV